MLVCTLASGFVLAAPADARMPAAHWPRHGEAAYAVNGGRIVTHRRQRAVPIASVAKVMTAYLVLRRDPLHNGHDGFVLRVSRHDVADTARRRGEDQSVVSVRAGEHLTERQALAALLLPSANNIAIMLARRVDGSVRAFTARMNRTAAALGMRHTHYTDPSGFASSTRSTARDQLVLAEAAMTLSVFRTTVARRSAVVPVAGRVRNTDFLLGHDGFVGIKTGSDSAAGGCFAFRTRRRVGGRSVVVTGVVLGQRTGNLIAAGQHAAKRLADSIGG